jgi:hypothetical protein
VAEINRLALRLCDLENGRRDFESKHTLARIDDTDVLSPV